MADLPPTRFEDEDAPMTNFTGLRLVFNPARGSGSGFSWYDIRTDSTCLGTVSIASDAVGLALLFAASPTLLELAKRAYTFLVSGGTEAEKADLRYDVYATLWGMPTTRPCLRHPDAEVIRCGNDECYGRFLCLGVEPHHLDDDSHGLARWDADVTRRLQRQVDAWFEAHALLPTGRHFSCPVCGHQVFARWRSAGDAIKITCSGCPLQTDVARPPNARPP